MLARLLREGSIDRVRGVPQPGIFLLDSDQKIIGKYFVHGYRERPDLDRVRKISRI